jgi:CRISPR-associated endonuclease/helicase Cas3
MSTHAMEWYAHSEARQSGRRHLLRDHLSVVSELAAMFADPAGLSLHAALAGIAHDLGKYGELFQLRLEGGARHVDHWTPGAWVALTHYRDVLAALAVEGHHVGLQRLDKRRFLQWDPAKWTPEHHDGRNVSIRDITTLIERAQADGVRLPESGIVSPVLPNFENAIGTMLDVRMVFSALTDADFLDTEAHFDSDAEGRPRYRPMAPALDATHALAVVEAHVRRLAKGSLAANILRLRQSVWQSALEAGQHSDRLWTLTAPTGSGKTWSMLAFALRHAAVYGKRRIIVVLPYLNIIEQTARAYRDVLEPYFGGTYVVEDHSLADPDLIHSDGCDDLSSSARLAAENWDAPLIITTTVNFLESLFTNRPGSARKLHRLVKSVILFDEVQLLPTHLLTPTLAALAYLRDRYDVTLVLATATQPAFSLVNPDPHFPGQFSWWAREMMPPDLEDLLPPRVYAWEMSERHADGRDSQSWDWAAVAEIVLASHPQVLVIVNVKAHAYALMDAVQTRIGSEGVYHLSTNMCPKHRRDVLEAVKHRLDEGASCYLVATQTVEAGVDIDFPVVFRAWAPLEALAQAAGRCNRHGTVIPSGDERRPSWGASLTAGTMIVFVPPTPQYPSPEYRRAAELARLLIGGQPDGRLDLWNPEQLREYYARLYRLSELGSSEASDLVRGLHSLDFEMVARHYRLIPDARVNVLVPYGPDELYDELLDRARRDGINRRWLQTARPLAVSVFRPKGDQQVHFVPITTPNGPAADWLQLTNRAAYDRTRGLCLTATAPVWIA